MPNRGRHSQELVVGMSDRDAYLALVAAKSFIPYNPHNIGNYEHGEEAWDLNNPPPVLGRLEPPAWYVKGLRTDGPVQMLRNRDGKLMRGTFGGLLRDVRLPSHIKTNVDAVLLETWFRLDAAITYADIRNRQQEDAVAYHYGTRNMARANSNWNAYRVREARQPLGLMNWNIKNNRRRGYVARTTLEAIGELTDEQIAWNTSWVITPAGIHPPTNPLMLYPHDLFLGKKGKYPHHPSPYLVEILECREVLRQEAARQDVNHWLQLPKAFLSKFFTRTAGPTATPPDTPPEEHARPARETESPSDQPIDLDAVVNPTLMDFDASLFTNPFLDDTQIDPTFMNFDPSLDITNPGSSDMPIDFTLMDCDASLDLTNPNLDDMQIDPILRDFDATMGLTVAEMMDFDATMGLTDASLMDFDATMGLTVSDLMNLTSAQLDHAMGLTGGNLDSPLDISALEITGQIFADEAEQRTTDPAPMSRSEADWAEFVAGWSVEDDMELVAHIPDLN